MYFCRNGRWFQVPKGMLQTAEMHQDDEGKEQVSSPQGNATNGLPSKEDPRFPTWFQVPKGMLQTIWCDLATRKGIFVSSPQGNATNKFRVKWVNDENLCFKSPRECYKLTPTPEQKPQIEMFQVPKGMLQTFSRT